MYLMLYDARKNSDQTVPLCSLIGVHYLNEEVVNLSLSTDWLAKTNYTAYCVDWYV